MSNAISITHIVPGYSKPMPWTWSQKPNARDLKDHGGRCEVKATMTRFPVVYAVREGSDLEPWKVEVLDIVGTTHRGELFRVVDTFNCFADALRDAKRRCRAAIAKATGEK